MGPASTKNNGKQDFFFSATSPPVQINKQAIQMNTQNQQPPKNPSSQMGHKQKDPLGHVATAVRNPFEIVNLNLNCVETTKAKWIANKR